MGGRLGFTFHWPVSIPDMEIEFTGATSFPGSYQCTASLLPWILMVETLYPRRFDLTGMLMTIASNSKKTGMLSNKSGTQSGMSKGRGRMVVSRHHWDDFDHFE